MYIYVHIYIYIYIYIYKDINYYTHRRCLTELSVVVECWRVEQQRIKGRKGYDRVLQNERRAVGSITDYRRIKCNYPVCVVCKSAVVLIK